MISVNVEEVGDSSQFRVASREAWKLHTLTSHAFTVGGDTLPDARCSGFTPTPTRDWATGRLGDWASEIQ